ncbi:MAG: nitroreductase [Clostridia bacterium]|nr:nitroreductase [Clostridia bacterium]
MTIQEAMQERHSVRSYQDRPIPDEIISALQAETDACNAESGLHIQLVTNEKEAYKGKFDYCSAYIALVGKKTDDFSDLCGYYGERIAIAAQMLGLNSCWTALSFSKGAVKKNVSIQDGEKLCMTIALGYGTTQGTPHKSKSPEKVSSAPADAPSWFADGVAAALLAPTAINQQKFTFTYTPEGKVAAKAGFGPYAKVDLGIVKYHFVVGSGQSRDIFI